MSKVGNRIISLENFNFYQINEDSKSLQHNTAVEHAEGQAHKTEFGLHSKGRGTNLRYQNKTSKIKVVSPKT